MDVDKKWEDFKPSVLKRWKKEKGRKRTREGPGGGGSHRRLKEEFPKRDW